MLVLFIFIWNKSQRIGSSFVCLKPGLVVWAPPELSPLGRFWLGGPCPGPEWGCGKGPGLWVQIPVLPQPWSANDLQNEEPIHPRGSPLQEGRRREGAGDALEGAPPEGPVTCSMRGAWTRVPGPGVLTGRSACGPPCSCAWSRGRMGYRGLPDGNSAMPPSLSRVTVTGQESR